MSEPFARALVEQWKGLAEYGWDCLAFLAPSTLESAYCSVKVAYELLDGLHRWCGSSGMKRDELLVCFPDRPWSHLRVWRPIEC